MGNGIENRLNFSNDVKQGLSQNAMTEEMARQFLIENGVPEEKINTHLSMLKSVIDGQKSRTREYTLDALLTLYSYISGKGFTLYSTPFVNSSENNGIINVASQAENISTAPVTNAPEKTVSTPQKEEKSEVATDKKSEANNVSSSADRQKIVREYFANRGNETVVVKWKEMKISTLLAGNALKDGKVWAITLALEEKMRAEQNKKNSQNTTTETPKTDATKKEVQSSDNPSPEKKDSKVGQAWEEKSTDNAQKPANQPSMKPDEPQIEIVYLDQEY